jgi:ribosomal protein S18 acetylase RimI-like enzyme
MGADAMVLLRAAAVEARALYPELFADAHHAPPSNLPTPPRGAYLVAYQDDEPVACGAIRPLDDHHAEVRRIFVLTSARRRGLASAVMRALESRARGLGFRSLRLETGHRQAAAIALYSRLGYVRIDPFGPYVGDASSVCFEKPLVAAVPQGREGSTLVRRAPFDDMDEGVRAPSCRRSTGTPAEARARGSTSSA